MMPLVDMKEGYVEQWALRQIEADPCFLSRKAAHDRRVLFFRTVADIPHRERQRLTGSDDLDRLLIEHRKCRPENFMAADDLLERKLHGLNVQHSGQPHSQRNVVKGA